MTCVLTLKDKMMELVKFVTINVKLAKMLTLVFLVLLTLTELPPQTVHVLMDTMITDLMPFVFHVAINVPLVTTVMTVSLVPPEDKTPQLVIAHPDNSITELPNVLIVVTNVLNVLTLHATVPFVKLTENKTLNQLVLAHQVPSKLMEPVNLVDGLVMNVSVTP